LGRSRKDPQIFAVRRGRGDKIVSDNSKCIRTSEGGRGVNFQFPPWGGMDVFWNDPLQNILIQLYRKHSKYSKMYETFMV
jgi:hypothetical protein